MLPLVFLKKKKKTGNIGYTSIDRGRATTWILDKGRQASKLSLWQGKIADISRERISKRQYEQTGFSAANVIIIIVVFHYIVPLEMKARCSNNCIRIGKYPKGMAYKRAVGITCIKKEKNSLHKRIRNGLRLITLYRNGYGNDLKICQFAGLVCGEKTDDLNGARMCI